MGKNSMCKKKWNEVEWVNKMINIIDATNNVDWRVCVPAISIKIEHLYDKNSQQAITSEWEKVRETGM